MVYDINSTAANAALNITSGAVNVTGLVYQAGLLFVYCSLFKGRDVGFVVQCAEYKLPCRF